MNAVWFRHWLPRVIAILIVAVTLDGSASAGNKRAKKKVAEQKKKSAPVNEEALAELMGPYRFGMTKEQVLKKLGDEIRERYKEQIQETADVYQQDKLRVRRDEEIARIRDSYLAFDGKRTGWDVSIIDDQFAHRTGESMMVYWENIDGKDQRRFFFFADGKLYKMFIALNSSVLKDQQKSFAYFQHIMEERYGEGDVQYVTDKEGNETPYGLSWRSSKYLVRALDKLDFYGSFCVSVADNAVEKRLAVARAAVKKPPKKNTVIESVVTKDGQDEKPDLRENEKAVDNLIK
jgi:hypothetical protein